MNDYTIAVERQKAHDELVRSIRDMNAPRRYTPGRQVLIPGKRKAARHPWADRLHAARNAGFIVEQEGEAVHYKCYACGAGGGIAGGFSGNTEDYDAQDYFETELRRHESRECVAAEVSA